MDPYQQAFQDKDAMSSASGHNHLRQETVPTLNPALSPALSPADDMSDVASVYSQRQVPVFQQPSTRGPAPQLYVEDDDHSVYSHAQSHAEAAGYMYAAQSGELPGRRPSAPVAPPAHSGPIYSTQFHSGPLQPGPGGPMGPMAYSGPIPMTYTQPIMDPNMVRGYSPAPQSLAGAGGGEVHLSVLHGMILSDLTSVRRKVMDYMGSSRSGPGSSVDPMERGRVQDALAQLEQQQYALGSMLQQNGIDAHHVVSDGSMAGSVAGDIPDLSATFDQSQREVAINNAIHRLHQKQQHMVGVMNQAGIEMDMISIPPPPATGDPMYPHAAIEEGDDEEDDENEPDPYDAKPFQRKTKVNWLGLFIFVVFMAAFGFYMYIRIRYTLNIGVWLWYGIIVLMGEMMGALAVFLYAICITVKPLDHQLKRDPGKAPPKPKYRYHIRVLVPCYRESLAILQRTIMASYNATLPPGCTRTVYLCDDGKDPKKAEWVDSLDADDVVYVSGRKRKPGEMNGKSCNLNNCLKQIYPKTPKQGMISMREVICVFDADQVPSQEFYSKTVHLLDSGSDVAMILSPQCFYNINPGADIFNNSNIHFWEYMQPGYDAMGFISCTGTNFLCRARALQECGWFPEDTVTEDFGLGIQLTKLGWNCRYVQEYLAIGEAPEEVRNTFQQRSRWCKGHFQIMFSSQCPLFDRQLNMFHRIMTCSSVFSYTVNCVTTPMLWLVPIVSIWFGVFPIALNYWFALGITTYGIALAMVQNYHHTFRHLKVLWFANLGNTLLWTVYFKAFINTGIGQLWKGSITFKATAKGRGGRGPSALKDLWIHIFMFLTALITVIVGLAGLNAATNLPLVISIIFAFYNCIPYYLVIHYAWIGRKGSLKVACMTAMVLQWTLQLLAVILVWVLLPRDYDYERALQLSVEFFETQRSGIMPRPLQPATAHLEWRGDAALLDGASTNFNDDEQQAALIGGWFTTGLDGHTKYTVAVSYTVTMLCWAYTEFKSAFANAQNEGYTLNNIKWATDYLKGTHIYNSNRNAEQSTRGVVWVIGDPEEERELWMRPEDIDYERDAVIITKGAQVFSTLAASFAACHRSLADVDRDYANDLLERSISLYERANFELSPLNSNSGSDEQRAAIELDQPDQSNPLALSTYSFQSDTFYDDMLWAASWLDLVADDYQEDVYVWYEQAERARQPDQHTFNWDDLFYGANLLLLQKEGGNDDVREEIVAKFLKEWVCGEPEEIDYTALGRAQNENEPSLSQTVNMAFLALMYAKLIRGQNSQAYVGYRCWATSQARYILGDNVKLGTPYSWLIGYGPQFPTQVYDRAASCPPQRAGQCTVAQKTSSQANPNVLVGALVHGPPKLVDDLRDRRDEDNVDMHVRLDWNAAVPGLFAGLVDLGGSWAECLQGYGASSFGYHPVCNPL